MCSPLLIFICSMNNERNAENTCLSVSLNQFKKIHTSLSYPLVCNKIKVCLIMLKLVLCYYDYAKEHMSIDYNYAILVNFVNYSKLHCI